MGFFTTVKYCPYKSKETPVMEVQFKTRDVKDNPYRDFCEVFAPGEEIKDEEGNLCADGIYDGTERYPGYDEEKESWEQPWGFAHFFVVVKEHKVVAVIPIQYHTDREELFRQLSRRFKIDDESERCARCSRGIKWSPDKYCADCRVMIRKEQ